MIHQLQYIKRCLLLSFILSIVPAYAENQVITLGTGGVTGLYYPTGGALCRLINQTRQTHGIRCAVRSTLGSVTNLVQVANHELDMGIAEAGQLYNAYKSASAQSKIPLRLLTSLYPEYISILVRSDAGIQRFEDLKNKRINIGKLGTSQRYTIELLMKAHGLQQSDFKEVTELAPAEQATALCDNRIDATLYVVGHPSGTIKEALRDCQSQLIGLSKQDRNTLIRQNPHYREMSVSGNIYSEDVPDVLTVGVNASLFARADLPDDVAYAVVKSLFEQFENFKKLHPAFRLLNPEQMMAPSAMPLPLHPGAAKYFREVQPLSQAQLE
ncbi:TAXI family TRAP transporter solute-binding subunit [Neptunomonas japonica]|uniref:TAXI family TRAP transporter solute-binding subunit n=1 Tax=Neptunomonas japonica TaxID=417574 RepID=UPI0004270496|nr:TAXI family TRAP transporter solute-binding subunit [Neptunomonas japonica]